MAAHEAALVLPDPHPSTEGHFSGNPIIPGAVLLQTVVDMIGTARPGDRCLSVPATKFLAPVRPGATLTVGWDDTGADIRFTAEAGGVRVMTGTLRFGAA